MMGDAWSCFLLLREYSWKGDGRVFTVLEGETARHVFWLSFDMPFDRGIFLLDVLTDSHSSRCFKIVKSSSFMLVDYSLRRIQQSAAR